MRIYIYYNILNDNNMEAYYHPELLEAGIDEAGRGSLIGPVFAAAVIWPKEDVNELELKDSKKLSRRQRLILKDYIEENAIDYDIGQSDHICIEKYNILQATMKAMHQAISELNVEPEILLIDGNYFKPYLITDEDNEIEKQSFPINIEKQIPYECIIGGDDTYNSIAAASILAKIYHDQAINKLCDEYPELDEYYDLKNNMGYGTKKHLQGLKEHGLSKFHRKNYNPCKKTFMLHTDVN